MNEIWYVSGADDKPVFWATKEDAERYARYMFPNEDIETRYSLIYYREVMTWDDWQGWGPQT